MNSSNYRFTLDVHCAQSQVSVPALLGDTGRVLHISLTDGGVPYIITDGCLAELSIKRPTGTYIKQFCIIEDNTTIKYDFSTNEYTAAVEGIHDCEITLYGADGTQLTSPRFSMVVSSRAVNSDDINISDEDVTTIENIVLAEAARVDAEEARVVAESDRVAAEEAREERFNNYIYEGIGLPIVDTSDNGKFLRVVGGEWSADDIETYSGETEMV